jgi:carboxyl-terminal processing protease
MTMDVIASARKWQKMRIKQFALVFLVVSAMLAGFAARGRISSTDPFSQTSNQRLSSRQLSASAPSTPASDVGVRSDVDLRPFQTFYDSLRLLREEYVEPIEKPQEHGLAYGSLRVMLDSLHDPLTRFLEPNQAQLVEDARAGKFYGIGANIAVVQEKKDGISEERLVVVSTLPGSPARKAGLLTGDAITELDGKSILPYDPFQHVEKIIKAAQNGTMDREKLPKLLEAESERIKNGVGFQKVQDTLADKGSKEYTLTVARPGAKSPLKVKVASQPTVVDPVTYNNINPSVGYVHVNLLTKPAEQKFAEAIAGFRKQGVKAVVVDLRDSPGGSIESAQAIAGDLIVNKTVTILQLPHGKQRILKAIRPASTEAVWDGPVAVIVNGGTSGVSEVLAAAIRDSKPAKLVGSRTSGANMDQTFTLLRDGSAVTITTGKFLTPKGADYRGKGLMADVTISSRSAKPGEDPQLAKAVEMLTSGKGRG